MNDQPGRRFLQTFVLCPQTPKKYYVHNDVFQWLDHAFVDLVPQTQQQESSAPPEGTVEVEETKCESEAVNEQPEEQQHAEQDVHSEHETAIEKHDEHYTDETP
uniref:NTF2 domain-containing protein n=1 Tax=Parascaris equorum TaxID=6256 RepID=A0A914R2L6_PAREQ